MRPRPRLPRQRWRCRGPTEAGPWCNPPGSRSLVLTPTRRARQGTTSSKDPDRHSEESARAAFASRPVTAIAAGLALLLVAFSGRYGFHRDELYFIECGRHLSWGYPDQPPLVPLVARLMSELAPGSLVVLRLPSALASGSLVFVTGLTAGELGADRYGQTLAAASIAVASMTMAAGHLLSTTTIDLAVWGLLCLLVVRILHRGGERQWLVVGLVCGIGLFDTDLVAFLIVRDRRRTRDRRTQAPLQLGLALRGWRHRTRDVDPISRLAGDTWLARARGRAVHRRRWLGHVGVALGTAPRTAGSREPLSGTGVGRRSRAPLAPSGDRWCRAVGVAYIVLAVVFVATGQRRITWVRCCRCCWPQARNRPSIGAGVAAPSLGRPS